MAAAYDRGKKALEAKDYPTAIQEFTSAIKSNPEAPSYYLDRSSAHLRNNNSGSQAVDDAEAGLLLAKARDRGQIIGKAQFRRGVALYQLGRYRDAGRCFEWAREKDPGEKMLGIWDVKVKNKLDTAAATAAGEGVEVEDGVGVLQYPEKDVVKRAQGVEIGIETEGSKPAAATTTATTTTTTSTTTTISTPKEVTVSTPPSQIRHDWYQSTDTVTLSLMVKGVPKDRAIIEIENNSISISFPLPTGSDYNFSLDPLYAAIDPTQSTFKILSTKIELTLKKCSPSTKWHSLEGEPIVNDNDTTTATPTTTTTTDPKPPLPTLPGPIYPSSSKTGPKNWDKVVHDLSKRPKPKATTTNSTTNETTNHPHKPEDLESDTAYISDDEEGGAGGDPVNSFFKKLFKNADPDTRRAMMKSYTESNGTALSTNWDEVRKAPVETRPPEGMEEIKYEI